MDIKILVKLTSRAWSLTILSLLSSGVAGRQAVLLAKSGASRTAFSQSLHHLVEMEMLERNPGHGHPLRPEFRLTEQGRVYGAVAQKVLHTVPTAEQSLTRKLWTVPILVALKKPQYFNEIKLNFPKITDRALSQSLQSMELTDWVKRDVIGAHRPPRPIYRAVNVGEEICRVFAV